MAIAFHQLALDSPHRSQIAALFNEFPDSTGHAAHYYIGPEVGQHRIMEVIRHRQQRATGGSHRLQALTTYPHRPAELLEVHRVHDELRDEADRIRAHLLQFSSQHRAREGVAETPVLHEKLRHGYNVGEFLNLIDENERFARFQGRVGHERYTTQEFLSVPGAGERFFRGGVAVEVHFHEDIVEGLAEMTYERALTNLARAPHQKGGAAVFCMPVEHSLVGFALKHDAPLLALMAVVPGL